VNKRGFVCLCGDADGSGHCTDRARCLLHLRRLQLCTAKLAVDDRPSSPLDDASSNINKSNTSRTYGATILLRFLMRILHSQAERLLVLFKITQHFFAFALNVSFLCEDFALYIETFVPFSCEDFALFQNLCSFFLHFGDARTRASTTTTDRWISFDLVRLRRGWNWN
jgi:hypothetical protein